MASQTKMWDPEFVLGVSLRKPTCLGHDYITQKPCGVVLSSRSAVRLNMCFEKLSQFSPLTAASQHLLLVPAASFSVCEEHWREARRISGAWKHHLEAFSRFEEWCDGEIDKAIEAAERMEEDAEHEEDDGHDDDDEKDDLAEEGYGHADSNVYSADKGLTLEIDSLLTGNKGLDLLSEVISEIENCISDVIAKVGATSPSPHGPNRTPTAVPPENTNSSGGLSSQKLIEYLSLINGLVRDTMIMLRLVRQRKLAQLHQPRGDLNPTATIDGNPGARNGGSRKFHGYPGHLGDGVHNAESNDGAVDGDGWVKIDDYHNY